MAGSGETAISTQNEKQRQSVWSKLPDVPHYYSSITVVDGVLLAIGGAEDELGTKKTSAICALDNSKWKHIGDMPSKCSWVDTVVLTDNKLLVVDGESGQVQEVTGKGLATKYNYTYERWLYEEAMKNGCVETSVTKCLILGAAGVGKTHLKHLLLKKDPPKQRISTGLANNPIRTISFSLAGVDGQEKDDWFEVEDDKALMSVIGGTIRDGVSKEKSSAVVVSTPKMDIDLSNVPGYGAVSPTPPASVNITKDTTQPEQSRTADELVHHIKQSSDDRKLFGVNWIQFIDSGGQLQYHDILPLFIQDPMVVILVLKLSEELSHHPSIEYYGADGKSVGKPYQSFLSHKQILQNCLGAIHSQGAHPLIIIVGTHRDAECKCSESCKNKDLQLQELLDPAYFHMLYAGEGMNELIFTVNGLYPEDVDRHVAQVLRNQIVSKLPKHLVQQPLAWFGMEIDLRRSSHDGVLSLAECRVLAKRFHIEGDVFSAALNHLVKYNVFLYYPKVLPHTVFCDPQVVLTKVTELVQYHHKLRDNPDKDVAITGDLVMFRDHGLLSVALIGKFPRHYNDDLFTPQDLVKLLGSCNAIATIKDGLYLMPALLPYLDSTQVTKLLLEGASLMITFTHSYIPSGLFCCLVAHLISSSWKACSNRGTPMFMYRNCIRLVNKDTSEIITLVEKMSSIAVHVHEASSAVCMKTKDLVHSGIKSACGVLKYCDIEFKDAFMCAGARCTLDPPHVAVVVCSESKYKWMCSILDDQTGDLSKNQLMWFMSETGKKPTMEDLMNDVAAEVPFKWRFIGIQLKVPKRDLDNIQSEVAGRPNMNFHAFEMMLNKWMTLDPQYTWSTIIGALEKPSVGEVTLAAELRKKYL